MSGKYKYIRETFYYNGRRYEVKGKTQKEALEKAADLKAMLKNGDVGISGNMTVSRWADEWLETYKSNSIGEGQKKNYELYLGIIKDSIGSRRLKDIKDIDLQKILNKRIGNSKSDLSKLRMTIRSLFKRARISRLIPYDPAEDIVMPTAEDGTHRSITPQERAAILKLAETHYAGLWIKTMLYCGVRPGEARALDWRHVDFEENLLKIEQAMKAGTKRIAGPKSEKGIRAIPIPATLMKDFIAARKGPFDPIFVQPTTGRRHTKTSMQSLWNGFKRALDIAGGAKLYRNKILISTVAPDLVPYCLRHTYGTDLQNAGIPINVAKYLMGHSDITTTANIYTHTTKDIIKEAADKIDSYIINL